MNKYNPNIHHRRSIRLKGYDYSQAGLYFVTICVQNRECLFGKIINKEMILNDAGQLVETEWLKLPERFNNIQLHEFIVMPNHFHGIMEIVGATLVVAPDDIAIPNDAVIPNDIVASNDIVALNVEILEPQNGQPQNGQPQNGQPQNGQPQNGQPQGIAPTDKTIGNMLGAFQSIVTVEYIRGVKNRGWKPFYGKLWQRNYWEHIIRNEQSYQRIAEYIINNPAKWANDKFYTDQRISK